MGNFYQDVISADPRFHANSDIRDLNLLEPVTRTAVQQIIADAAAMGITLEVTETYRSDERQEYLFNQHKTKLRHVGAHHYGLAVDFCKIIDGLASWAGDWTFLCDLARNNGMISGGDWGQPYKEHDWRDWDHVQRVSVADQNRLFAGTFYPDDEYNPNAAA